VNGGAAGVAWQERPQEATCQAYNCQLCRSGVQTEHPAARAETFFGFLRSF